ncbi:MAG: hypothetical protein JJU27_08020 [Gammaproteobacteria bacterium]|nr:hypothetical protein [Gammaproteobacteria bacterium]
MAGDFSSKEFFMMACLRPLLALVLLSLLMVPARAESPRPITVLVKWPIEQGVSPPAAAERVRTSIPYYEGRPGLIRKYISINSQAGYGYGIYLWESRELAEKFYEEMKPIIAESTGAEPEIEYLDTLVVVDNVTGETEVFDSQGAGDAGR